MYDSWEFCFTPRLASQNGETNKYATLIFFKTNFLTKDLETYTILKGFQKVLFTDFVCVGKVGDSP